MRPSLLCSLLLLLLLILLGFSKDLRSEAQQLPQQEVEALRRIATKLKKRDWDFGVDPCSRLGGWVVNATDERFGPISNVTCDCSFDNYTVCHVVSLQLMRLNLTGTLPEEVANLTYLGYLDLSRNYLSGTIPASWGSLPVTNLSLQGNRLSGKIPKELGRMPALLTLQLENNELEGPLPAELGNLSTLDRLFVSANNIEGELPPTFAMLRNLTDFRIDGNNITGNFPDFVQNWRKIHRIDMQGTLLSGPISSSISFLRNLTELRVTDLHGPYMTFPALQNAEHLTELVLRNCSIYGKIPPYLGNMKYLKVLDLSFNYLTGTIPQTFVNLIALEYMYLTNNILTGDIPGWMLRNGPSNKKNMDISYNNFTGSPPTDCQEGNVNMVSSFSSSQDNSILWCLRKDLPCRTKPRYTSLFINCGGTKVKIGEYEYDDDSSQIGTSTFHPSESGRWAYSSTGDFVGNEDADYIAKNMSVLNMTDAKLYTDARLSPLSLKYYGLCLQNGNYSVKLHFAEIMFTEDQTFSSNGKRVFDILIQGSKVLKNFNIEAAAGGAGREIIMNFTTSVTDNTLEIHLYWAGKGTTAMPVRGVYGPLISAISVTKFSNHHTRLSVGAMVGIIGAVCLFIIFMLLFIWTKGCCPGNCIKKYGNLGSIFHDLGQNTTEFQMEAQYFFSLKQIEAATKNFDPLNKIGEGGFGPVYKGFLADGTVVAVKQLSSKSRQGNREFLNEIGMISALRHPNLVRLFGCCIEEDQLLLIYEYMENNSLGRALFGHEESRLKLTWSTRCMIILGIARGLAFLHEESRLKIVHRDIKLTNILLDKDLNPKISDFGLAKLDDDIVTTRIAGTIGYMAPEYATRGHFTHKADVYSFGVVILEVISGKSNTKYMPNEDYYLLDWANILLEQGRLLELVDPSLGLEYLEEEALRMLTVALLCTKDSPAVRPAMSTVLSMLSGETPAQAPFEHVSVEDRGATISNKFSLENRIRVIHVDELSTDSSVSLDSKEFVHFPSSSRSLPDTANIIDLYQPSEDEGPICVRQN